MVPEECVICHYRPLSQEKEQPGYHIALRFLKNVPVVITVPTPKGKHSTGERLTSEEMINYVYVLSRPRRSFVVISYFTLIYRTLVNNCIKVQSTPGYLYPWCADMYRKRLPSGTYVIASALPVRHIHVCVK